MEQYWPPHYEPFSYPALMYPELERLPWGAPYIRLTTPMMCTRDYDEGLSGHTSVKGDFKPLEWYPSPSPVRGLFLWAERYYTYGQGSSARLGNKMASLLSLGDSSKLLVSPYKMADWSPSYETLISKNLKAFFAY